MQIPSTDTLCILPVVQQIIGGATFLSNLVKTIYDIAKAILTKTWKGGLELYEERSRAFNTPQEEEVNQRILSLPGYQFEMHTLGMMVGIIRAIPLVGTLYSLAAHYDMIKLKQNIDDPRQEVVPFRITPHVVYT
ncbi:MAG: hypothetical protein H0V82_08305 [Candidatus Protochlamydia sp.]|nr:hypothetical protein [Candidatus Protochlamydia sp.]